MIFRSFRSASVGGTKELVSLMGSAVPLPKKKAGESDPRRSIEERYASRDAYLTETRRAADDLVKRGYLLADDLPQIVKRAEEAWEFYVR